MDTQHHDYVPGIDELERKAEELISLILSLCEEQISKVSDIPDAALLPLSMQLWRCKTLYRPSWLWPASADSIK